MTEEAWFTDAADAKRYIAEVARVWVGWLAGLAALALSRGAMAVIFGLALLVAMFFLVSPLQQRVQDRFEDSRRADRPQQRRFLSARDRALRDLTYGRKPFAEAIQVSNSWAGLKLIPWLVTIATFVGAAFIAVAWFEG